MWKILKYGLWHLFLLAWGVCEFIQKLNLDSIYCLIFHVGRGTSRGSAWLSWQTPLHRRYSALKLIKYQELSLQVSNAGVLEQATAYISLLTLHSTITKSKQQHYCLVQMAPAYWHETTTFLNTRNWYCVKRTCFWIFSSGSASSNAVRISYTATYTQELFCRISLHGERTAVSGNFICCLHILGYDKIKQV